jgi:hypothetical protein
MCNLKDVIDVDGTKRTFDIDTAELGEMSPGQNTAAVTFRGPDGVLIKILVGRTSHRVLAGWIAQGKAKNDRKRGPESQVVAA